MSGPGAYARAGVDLDASDAIKRGIGEAVESTRTELVRAGFGSFGGAFSLPPGYADPVLVTSIDGVGTKLHLALTWGRPGVAGRDLVNHSINDIGVLAARPIAFLDYVASGDLDAVTVNALVEGMAEACKAADVAIVGGETAQMPGTYAPGAYDLVGTMVGIVERAALPDPGSVQVGDVLVGLPSLGLHTNGFSLARRVAEDLGPDHPVGEASLADALLAPHTSYLDELQAAFGVPGVRIAAHITGGGLEGNLPRVLPGHLAARVEVGGWPVLPVFDLIAEHGEVDQREMYRVFNMGLGLVFVVAPGALPGLEQAVPGALRVGEVVERRADGVVLVGL
ncbi:phosphoribosylformylglycinamidine cyclo-ligase [soil metagenome]